MLFRSDHLERARTALLVALEHHPVRVPDAAVVVELTVAVLVKEVVNQTTLTNSKSPVVYICVQNQGVAVQLALVQIAITVIDEFSHALLRRNL